MKLNTHSSRPPLAHPACLALVLLCSGAAPTLAQAEDDPRQDEEVNRESIIIVTAGGLADTPGMPAYSTVELDRTQILTTPSGRIEDVLGAIAGFQQFRRSDSRSSNPSAQGVTLRALGGNATSRALVTLDGVPIADPFFGYVPLSSIMPESLASVRVLRGGGSGPFGSGALAGTIALESAGPDRLPRIGLSALVNDRGATEASALGFASLARGFVAGAVRWDRGSGFYTTPQDQRVPTSTRAAFDSVTGSIRAVAPVNEALELQARLALFDDRRTLRFEGADSSSQGQDASVRLVARGAWQFDALAYLQARNFSNVVISSTRFVRVLDQRNTPSTGLGGKVEMRPPLGDAHVLRLGMDYRRASGELQEESYSAFSGNLSERRRAGGVTENLGLFVEHDWNLGALVVTGGLRLDHSAIRNGFYRAVDNSGAVVTETVAEDRSDWALTYRAGLAWQASDALRLRGAAYSGLRLPTLNELYRPFVVFPVVTQANAGLRNERLEGFEAGFDWSPEENLSLSLTAFENRVENAIANVTLAPNLRQRRNLPAIDARGVELDLSARHGRLRLDGSLAVTDAQVNGEGPSLSLDGNRPPQVPRWSAAANVAWLSDAGWLASLTLRHIGAQFEGDGEDDLLPAATTLGAYVGLPISEKLRLVLRAENLTDEEIVTRNAGGAIDLGSPRTLWAGLRYGF